MPSRSYARRMRSRRSPCFSTTWGARTRAKAISTLRPRSVEDKGDIAQALLRQVWPLLESGRVRPIIYRTFPLREAAEAHRLMESSEHIGKIVLTV